MENRDESEEFEALMAEREARKKKRPALPLQYLDDIADYAALAVRESIKRCGVKKGVIARQIGTTASSLSAWIQGRRHLKVAHVVALADALERLTGRRYSLDEMCGRSSMKLPVRASEMPDPVDPDREKEE